MAGNPPPTPSLEDRVVALEKQAAQYVVPAAAAVAGSTPKLTTRQAGYLTAAALGLTWLGTHVVGLPDWAQGAITLVVTGITAYEAAEQT